MLRGLRKRTPCSIVHQSVALTVVAVVWLFVLAVAAAHYPRLAPAARTAQESWACKECVLAALDAHDRGDSVSWSVPPALDDRNFNSNCDAAYYGAPGVPCGIKVAGLVDLGIDSGDNEQAGNR